MVGEVTEKVNEGTKGRYLTISIRVVLTLLDTFSAAEVAQYKTSAAKIPLHWASKWPGIHGPPSRRKYIGSNSTEADAPREAVSWDWGVVRRVCSAPY